MALDWIDDTTFRLAGATFSTLAEGPAIEAVVGPAASENFWLAKPRSMIERYTALIDELAPRTIFELGILRGGSTAFFAGYARPDRLVAVDRRRHEREQLTRFLQTHRMGDRVTALYGVEQDDDARLRALVASEFPDGIDLVVDDASHQHGPTRTSFDVLFPHLREGGRYVIEDWPWEQGLLDKADPDLVRDAGPPLTVLLFDAVLAVASMPGLIDAIHVEASMVVITRGDLRVDADRFHLAACSSDRHRHW